MDTELYDKLEDWLSDIIEELKPDLVHNAKYHFIKDKIELLDKSITSYIESEMGIINSLESKIEELESDIFDLEDDLEEVNNKVSELEKELKDTSNEE